MGALNEAMAEELQRLVSDRQKLLVVLDAIYNLSWAGMDETTMRFQLNDMETVRLSPGYKKFSAICDEVAKIKAQVEGS